MADKLDWLNQHPLWFLYPTVSQVVTQNHLELSTALQNMAERFPIAEDYLKALWHEGQFKDACTFCAYNTVPRVAVWWAYLCTIDLRKELLLKPAQQVNISDIAKPRPLNIPEWCQISDDVDQNDPNLDKELSDLKNITLKIVDAERELQKLAPPSLVNLYNQAVESAFKSVKDKCGYDPRELLQEAIQNLEKIKDAPFVDEDNSPIFKAAQDLEQKIEKTRVETADIIKSVVPETDTEKQEKISAQCLDAVWAYITAPNENNAQNAFQLGNACPNLIEGLLSSIAFWSFGSLTPNSQNVVKTPAGLMANGINGLITKCAASVGGIYKPKERFERYFNLAFAVLTNQKTWDNYLERNTSPHHELQNEIAEFIQNSQRPTQAQATNAFQAPDANAFQNQHQSANASQIQAAQATSTFQAQDANVFQNQTQSANASQAQTATEQNQSLFQPSTLAQYNRRFGVNHGTAPQDAGNSSALAALDAALNASLDASSTSAEPNHPTETHGLPPTNGLQNTKETTPSANTTAQSSGTPAMSYNEIVAAKRTAEQEMQEQMAQIRANLNRRFRG